MQHPQLSPTVLRSSLRRFTPVAVRPGILRTVRLWARQQWEASVRPLRWDLHRLRHGDMDLASDVIGSATILFALTWFAFCAWRGVC